jgi:preprotein translocase subunit SecG
MQNVLLVIHLMVVTALVIVVLLQRSDGGALGIGGGGFMTGRGQANALTRATAILGAAFFTTSILLTIVGQTSAKPKSILEGTQPAGQSSPTQPPPAGSLLDQLQGRPDAAPSAPAGGAAGGPPRPAPAPAAPATPPQP